MTQIRDPRVDARERAREAERDRRMSDDQVRDLIKDVAKERVRASELAHVEVRDLPVSTQQLLSQLVARELKGQLPGPIMEALLAGQAGTDLLQGLTTRLANAAAERERYGQASTPESARAQATDTSTPQQALRWTQFVQRSQHVPGSLLRDRAGSAAPKGEGTTLAELIGQRSRAGGPGLRTPRLVERGIENLSPAQRDLLLRACVGDKLAQRLGELGIQDPLMLVKAGAHPDGRAQLADALGMDRGKLLTLLLRTELLKIGGGKHGELGIRPDLLGPLGGAGIGMLGTLAALRSLPNDQLSIIYALLRHGASGFARTMAGGRPPVKRDLLHWARSASRKGSEIMLADLEGHPGALSRGDAQELIQAWYLENLLWDALQNGRRYLEEQKRERRERDAQGDEGAEQEGEHEGAADDQDDIELAYDHDRQDHLMCFWITDYTTDSLRRDTVRRMYVCVDPDTGAILPQRIEADILPSPR
jgi:hypothetical protein